MIVSIRFPMGAAFLTTAALAGPAFPATQLVGQNYIQKSADAGTLQGGEVVFSGHHITIPVVAVGPGAPDTTFEVHGRVKPTLVVPAGARLRFELANNDTGTKKMKITDNGVGTLNRVSQTGVEP